MRKKVENVDKSKRVQCEVIFTNILYPRERVLKAGTWVSAKGRITKILDNGELLEQVGLISSIKECHHTSVNIVGSICSFDTLYDLGKPFKLTANVIEHSTYGLQLDILFISSLDKIDDKDGQYKFLSTILTSSQIDILYNSLENPFEVIQSENLEALTKIKGIGIKKAYDIINKFKRSRDNANAYVALYDLGLSKKRIDNLVSQFNSPDTLVDIIKENPYKLIELVTGFGWESADTLALNSGIHPLSEKRIKAYIFYFLESMGYGNLDAKYDYLSGSTWIEFMELYNIIIEKFPELHPDNEPELLINCFKKMLKKENEENEKEKPILKMIKVPTGTYDENGKEIILRKLALYKFWELENNIAQELLRIRSGELLKYNDPELSIKETEISQGFDFTEEQKEGIKIVLENQVCVVTGAAGTGKTSVVKGMLAALPQCNTVLTSFTGAAASRLSEVARVEGKTIHRLLQYVQGQGFVRNESNPLDTNIVILDETSMVSLDLFYSLLKAIKTGTKLVMVGDPNQLPSIGLGNLFKNIIESNIIPVAKLTKIHRQSARSGIVTEALKVSNGTQLISNGTITEEIRGELQDFKLITYEDSKSSADIVLNEFKRLYYEENIPIEDIQVIVPLRQRGEISTNYLNSILQDMVNPDSKHSSDDIVELETNDRVNGEYYKYKLKVKDKVRIKTNTYRGVFDLDGNDVQIFNGNRGIIDSIDTFTGMIVIDLGFIGKVVIPKEKWDIIGLSYASSCHSSQGSEFPYTIIGLDFSAYTLLNRNWLYTGITRSKKYCVLCSQNKALKYAISNSATDNKRTFLKDLLIELKKEQDDKIKKEEENF